MQTIKHYILLFFCIVFIVLVGLKTSTYHLAINALEQYNDSSYIVDVATPLEVIESNFQTQMSKRKTLYQQNNNSGNSGNEILNPYADCQGLFKCARTTPQDYDTIMANKNGKQGKQQTSNNTSSTNSTNSTLPSNKELSCNCPPQLSQEDILGLDLYNVEEKAIESALMEANSIKQSALNATRDYQDTLRDAMMDGIAKTDALTNASNILETSIQQQAVAGNMPDAMRASLNAVTTPITDKVNQLSQAVDQMRGIVDRTRARCNSVRFAFGKGCKI